MADDTLRSMILQTLRECGELEGHDLWEAVWKAYLKVEMDFDCRHFEDELDALVESGAVRKRKTKWEGERMYRAVDQRPVSQIRHSSLFAN